MCGVSAGLMQYNVCVTGVFSFRDKCACADSRVFRGFAGIRCASPTRQCDAELPAAERPVDWRLPGGPTSRRARACPGYGSGSHASSVISVRSGPTGKQRSRTCSPKQHGESSILKEPLAR